MRVFVDHCVNVLLLDPLSENLSDEYEFVTTPSKGWENLDNGTLLRRVESNFEVFFTGDTNLSEQRDLSMYELGYVVIQAQSNRIEDLISLSDDIAECLRRCEQGKLYWVRPDGIQIESVD